MKIGLLGGSFNPAHDGHVHISRHAKRMLGLDEVWWLLSPQNPLKPKKGMADYATRRAYARQISAPLPWLKICEIEHECGLRYTVDTLTILHQRYPQNEFAWLMGSDNLAQFHRWRDWQQIFAMVPIAVFDRAPHSHRALRAPAALHYGAQRIRQSQPALLFDASLPRWVYGFIPRHAQSATKLRNSLGEQAFLR